MRDEPAGAAEPGACPGCGQALEWLPVDQGRRGRICRACGWVALPEVTVERHTVNTLLRRLFPRSHLAATIDYLLLRLTQRRRAPDEDDG